MVNKSHPQTCLQDQANDHVTEKEEPR